MPSLTGMSAGTSGPNEWNCRNEDDDMDCADHQTQYGWWWGGDEWHAEGSRMSDYPCLLEVELKKSGRDSAVEEATATSADLVPDPPKCKKPWSESAVAKLMENIGKQQLGKSMNAKHLGAAKIAYSRGTALRAPAKKFFVLKNLAKATAQLSHIAKRGIGWFRTYERPEVLDDVLREAMDSDLTGNVLEKINNYARKNSVYLNSARIRGGNVTFADLT